MRLENLQLVNFKNYANCSFNFSPGINFIYGDNGNGKTNILEAISFLSYTKSFLQNTELDCVKLGEKYFEIGGMFFNNLDSVQKVSVKYHPEQEGKNFYLNGLKVNKLNDVIGSFPLVTLSPYDLKLTTGAPYERRRGFDLLISQTSRVYLNDLRNLSRILKQKNALLRDNLLYKKYAYSDLKQMISTWNEELLNVSIKILVRRLDFIENFRILLKKSFEELIARDYEPYIDIESDLLNDTFAESDIDHISGSFADNLAAKFEQEVKRGISLFGPHRDNYIFRMKKGADVFDVRTVASQGEHKMFIIALKLAEYKYISRYGEGTFKGEPVLILDDIFSELDGEKTDRLCSVLPSYNQMFVTTTDLRYRDKLLKYFNEENSRTFEIVNGAVAYAN